MLIISRLQLLHKTNTDVNFHHKYKQKKKSKSSVAFISMAVTIRKNVISGLCFSCLLIEFSEQVTALVNS